MGEEEELATRSVRLEQVNWLADPLAPGAGCEIQVRHRAKPISAKVLDASDGGLAVALDEPARAVAPGQSGVLYRGEQLLGGGVIA